MPNIFRYCLITFSHRRIINNLLRSFNKKKGAKAPVGIKNSWKYEKDLIILNENKSFVAIARPGNNFYLNDYSIRVARKVVNSLISVLSPLYAKS